MAQGAENLAPNILKVDTDTLPDGVVRIRVVGDNYDRVQIHLDGTIKAGDGSEAPATVSSSAAALAAHLADEDGAHAATAISFDDDGLLHATGATVAAAIASLDAAVEALQP